MGDNRVNSGVVVTSGAKDIVLCRSLHCFIEKKGNAVFLML